MDNIWSKFIQRIIRDEVAEPEGSFVEIIGRFEQEAAYIAAEFERAIDE